jgi:hypothetical protein
MGHVADLGTVIHPDDSRATAADGPGVVGVVERRGGGGARAERGDGHALCAGHALVAVGHACRVA